MLLIGLFCLLHGAVHCLNGAFQVTGCLVVRIFQTVGIVLGLDTVQLIQRLLLRLLGVGIRIFIGIPGILGVLQTILRIRNGILIPKTLGSFPGSSVSNSSASPMATSLLYFLKWDFHRYYIRIYSYFKIFTKFLHLFLPQLHASSSFINACFLRLLNPGAD